LAEKREKQMNIWNDPKWARRLLVIGWFLTSISTVMVIAAIAGIVNERHFIRTATKADAIVVEMVERSGDNGPTYAPVFTFTDHAGHEQKVYSRCSSYPPAYRVGDKIPVLYLPAAPRNAQIQGFFDMWGWMTIVGGLGVVYGIIGPVLLIVVRRQRDKSSQPSDAPSATGGQ